MSTRVLLITGGHGYEREPFLAMWKSLDGIALLESQYPAAEAYFSKEHSERFDAVVFYDFHQTLSAHAKQEFLAMLRRGKGLVFLHHALLGQSNWPEYQGVIGGAWIDKEQTIDTRVYQPSQYAPNQHVRVHVDRNPHPVTAGLQDFDLTDETYKDLYVAPDVTPLLTTTHPKSDRLLGWSRTYERSRIVYLQPGHGATAYNDTNFRRLLRQAINWVANRDATIH